MAIPSIVSTSYRKRRNRESVHVIACVAGGIVCEGKFWRRTGYAMSGVSRENESKFSSPIKDAVLAIATFIFTFARFFI